VGKLAECVNTILLGRQDEMQLSPRAVGEIVRRELGLKKKRMAGGVQITVDRKTCSTIHALARLFGVTRSQSLIQCEFCDADVPKTSGLRLSPSNHEEDVHNVHTNEGG
jgi:hypothetical protein